ncbi:DUF1798 family protein [Aquibacillus albus]|uniref:DUF1798 family protein n=1 Tax=Aquibacillus albus TaxID=1168171 RepID=A0ABS2MVK5_9BACI|nr:DUF1798 family protein [Aquibacillus albus]MBM7569866.1 hypothetical protein [Aquibacillus albus]
MNLTKTTRDLKRILEELKAHYLENEKPEDKRDKAFFEFVKHKTTPVYERLKKWEDEALEFVKNREVHVHPQQIASTKENMELLLLHSYYIDVKRKRYMELNQSVHYVLDILLNDLSNQTADS